MIRARAAMFPVFKVCGLHIFIRNRFKSRCFRKLKAGRSLLWMWAFAARIAVIPVVAFLETVPEGPVHHWPSADPGSPCPIVRARIGTGPRGRKRPDPLQEVLSSMGM